MTMFKWSQPSGFKLCLDDTSKLVTPLRLCFLISEMGITQRLFLGSG